MEIVVDTVGVTVVEIVGVTVEEIMVDEEVIVEAVEIEEVK